MPSSLIASLLALLLIPTFAQAHGGETHGTGGIVAHLPAEQHDWGIAGLEAKVDREIAITMSDAMRFAPDRLRVRLGETIRFRIANGGRLLHEMVIGTPGALAEHAALMKRFPNMVHDSPYMAHVPAGADGTIVWTFNRPGDFEFACLIPGHFEAGMVGQIQVEAP